MKKFFIIFLVLIPGSLLFAQSTFTIGPKAGVNFAKLSTDDASFSSKSITGYHGGGFIRITADRLYLQPELLFVHKGSELTNPSDPQYLNSVESKYIVTYDYTEIPILLGFRIIEDYEFNIRAFAGPVIAFAVGNDLELKLDGQSPPPSTPEYYNKDDLKKGLFAFSIGAGCDIGALTFDIRYDIGINDISSEFLFEKLNTFSISAGVKIFN